MGDRQGRLTRGGLGRQLVVVLALVVGLWIGTWAVNCGRGAEDPAIKAARRAESTPGWNETGAE